MSLLRSLVGLIVIVILAQVTLAYLGYGPSAHEAVSVIYRLGDLLQTPVMMFLAAGFYTTALAAAGAYFVLYLLLGGLTR